MKTKTVALSAEEVHKCFESFQLGFSSKELNEIIGLIADARFTDGEKGHEQGIPMETICAAFGISRDEMKGALLRDEQENARSAAGLGAETSWGCPVCTYVNDGAADVCGACSEPNPKHQEEDLQRQQQQQGWRCGNCTFINQPDDVCCTICELDMDGQRGVPRGKWVCAGEQGGCTFFNSYVQLLLRGVQPRTAGPGVHALLSGRLRRVGVGSKNFIASQYMLPFCKMQPLKPSVDWSKICPFSANRRTRLAFDQSPNVLASSVQSIVKPSADSKTPTQ
ncbi:hypothetical protein PRIC2_009498 [Phytophthora ramorum]